MRGSIVGPLCINQDHPFVGIAPPDLIQGKLLDSTVGRMLGGIRHQLTLGCVADAGNIWESPLAQF